MFSPGLTCQDIPPEDPPLVGTLILTFNSPLLWPSMLVGFSSLKVPLDSQKIGTVENHSRGVNVPLWSASPIVLGSLPISLSLAHVNRLQAKSRLRYTGQKREWPAFFFRNQCNNVTWHRRGDYPPLCQWSMGLSSLLQAQAFVAFWQFLTEVHESYEFCAWCCDREQIDATGRKWNEYERSWLTLCLISRVASVGFFAKTSIGILTPKNNIPLPKECMDGTGTTQTPTRRLAALGNLTSGTKHTSMPVLLPAHRHFLNQTVIVSS